MISTEARSALPRIDAPDWFAHAGEVIQSIGTKFFHRELIALLEASIPSDAVWIIRYSGEAPPDVVYTHNVSSHAMDVYMNECGGVDPFSRRWKATREPGVFTLETLRDESVEYLLYTRLFLPAAQVEDELGVIFPATAHNCFAFFLERVSGHFTRAEVARAQLMYPALESFYRAHLGWMFNELRYDDGADVTAMIDRPTLIEDRSAEPVWSNAAWNERFAAHPALAAQLGALRGGPLPQVELDDAVLKAEALGADFPLAPGGRMYVIEPRPRGATDDAVLSNVLQIFTPRERDILDLVMKGRNSAEIAETLGLGVGSVKNCKMRIYRKADVTTEAALVTKLMALYEAHP
ncbi:helix-turn-helix transcriptional regulator [Chenggangzhangella methanolivorans]|uniref:Helix-turn-helix transcriptional regulator n=1 Tax=Chenggangzhangella methanolivorans TaxID=1437009 RepID=A0A9E6UM45_9HYPH|nr:helix-turn-helix transcriptional regulator [Chenggangzhangella methanolivorans]QZN98803.1 helix-turn-helix transcriptional regulator [Chenggangzhangella methanolivorans]